MSANRGDQYSIELLTKALWTIVASGNFCYFSLSVQLIYLVYYTRDVTSDWQKKEEDGLSSTFHDNYSPQYRFRLSRTSMTTHGVEW